MPSQCSPSSLCPVFSVQRGVALNTNKLFSNSYLVAITASARDRGRHRWQPPCHSSGIITGCVSPNQDHISHKLHCFLPPSSLPLASLKKINMLEMSFPAPFLPFPPSAVQINPGPVFAHFLFGSKTVSRPPFMQMDEDGDLFLLSSLCSWFDIKKAQKDWYVPPSYEAVDVVCVTFSASSQTQMVFFFRNPQFVLLWKAQCSVNLKPWLWARFDPHTSLYLLPYKWKYCRS